jgi:hypothetical protein
VAAFFQSAPTPMPLLYIGNASLQTFFPSVHPIWNEPKEYYLFEDSIETYWHLSSADFILRILQTGRNNPRAKASAIGKSMGDRYFQAA